MKEKPRQSWKTCRFGIGNLADSGKENELIRVVYPKRDWEKLLEKMGINQDYYCLSSDLMKLNIYPIEGLLNGPKDCKKMSKLFSLNLNENYEGPSSLDLLGNERDYLDSLIVNGLRMCSHCKFYEPRKTEGKL